MGASQAGWRCCCPKVEDCSLSGPTSFFSLLLFFFFMPYNPRLTAMLLPALVLVAAGARGGGWGRQHGRAGERPRHAHLQGTWRGGLSPAPFAGPFCRPPFAGPFRCLSSRFLLMSDGLPLRSQGAQEQHQLCQAVQGAPLGGSGVCRCCGRRARCSVGRGGQEEAQAAQAAEYVGVDGTRN